MELPWLHTHRVGRHCTQIHGHIKKSRGPVRDLKIKIVSSGPFSKCLLRAEAVQDVCVRQSGFHAVCVQGRGDRRAAGLQQRTHHGRHLMKKRAGSQDRSVTKSWGMPRSRGEARVKVWKQRGTLPGGECHGGEKARVCTLVRSATCLHQWACTFCYKNGLALAGELSGLSTILCTKKLPI